MVSAPTVGRPAHGFSTARAQRWILAAAMITAITYGFRRVIEPAVGTAPARGGKAARTIGAGSPPPALSHWAIAYGAGFLMLSIISMGAPEVAASIAMLMTAGSLLTNGTSIVADLTGLEGTAAGSSSATGAPNLRPPNSTTLSTPSGLVGAQLPGGTFGTTVGRTVAGANPQVTL